MQRLTLDDYYLTEQDEPTVTVSLRGRQGSTVVSGPAVARDRSRQHLPASVRRRLRMLRLAAAVTLAA